MSPSDQCNRTAMVSSSPPRRKLIQNEPINAEIKNAAPAHSSGRHSKRLQKNMIPPPSDEAYAKGGGIMSTNWILFDCLRI